MATKKSKRYRVVFTRDEDGWWVAQVPKLDGCHTQGRSIAQARERIREAMDLFDVPRTARLEEVIDLGKLTAKVEHARQTREHVDELARASKAETARVATRLAKAGFSRRDVGELLGVSFQRVQQLVGR
ncbi:MAG: type II toxin-antitoxin system HicB family antitoxin [Polyangiaceae bacterium]|nr:type II toxin-antitoxin system HicB family antitoxin [Polyangiaceae bacterium]